MRRVLSLTACSAAVCLASADAAPDSAAASVLQKDVAIIGGGASGAYAAVRLREDMGLSVVVIEKQEQLGGHVDTYVDPASGKAYELGVQNFIDVGNSTDFFHRMGVPTAAPTRVALTSRFVDFTTGQALPGYTPPSTADRTAALERYLVECEKYESLMIPGYANFPPPDQIPADLLLPFGDFVRKHNISAAVPQIFETTGFGVYNLMKGLTLYVMRAFGASMARAILGKVPSFVPASHRNQDLYDRVADLLGADVLYSSAVVESERSKSGVTLRVRGGKKGEKQSTRTVHARRLLVAVPPTAENTAALDLDKDESAAFAALEWSQIYVGSVAHPSLPLNASLVNTPAAAQPADYGAALPAAPFNARFDHFGDPTRLFRTIMIGGEGLDSRGARDLVQEGFDNMVEAGTLPAGGPKKLRWEAFEAHGLGSARYSPAEVRAGFIQRLYALQGRRSTWYTGAAFSVHLTTTLWQYTDTVLPKVAEGL